MNHLYNLHPHNDNQPVSVYKFSCLDCFVTIGCAVIIVGIVYAGAFSILKMWAGV